MKLSKEILEKHKKQCDKTRRYWTVEENETIQQLLNAGIDVPEYIFTHAKDFGLENRSLRAIKSKINKINAEEKAEKLKQKA